MKNKSDLSRKIWLFVLVMSAFGGLQTAYGRLATIPFSDAKNTAHYIQANHLDQYPIMSQNDGLGMPVSGYLGKPIFYPNHNDFNTFILDDPKRKVEISKADLIDSVRIFLKVRPHEPHILLVLDPINDFSIFHVSANLKLKLLTAFTDGYNYDEHYYIYIIE